ncbi:MAG: fused MFS/spermidine synthase [Parvularculaceae bacterium]
MRLRLDRRVFAGGLIAALGAAVAPGARGQTPTYGSVARRESQYTTTYVDWEGDYLTMRFGINKCLFTETRYNPNDPAELPVPYTQYMTVGLAYASQLSRIVEIGLGGGRVATYLHDFIPSSEVICVELDPGVVELAQLFFGVRPGPRLRLITRDGRVYMAGAREAFDIVLIDAYQGTLVPFHLVTREFYAIVKRRLAPGGAVVQNIAPSVLDLERMVATANAVFDQVDVYDAGRSRVLIAYDGAAKSDAELLARAQELQQDYGLRYPLSEMLPNRSAGVESTQPPFTDDFAPVGYTDVDRRCRAG